MTWAECCSHGGQKPFATKKEEEMHGGSFSIRGDKISPCRFEDFSSSCQSRILHKLALNSVVGVRKRTAAQGGGARNVCAFLTTSVLPVQGY